jgi:hypothetical protein
MQVRVGLATIRESVFESEDGNALEEPKLECAPGHSIDPSVAGSAHGAHPGDAAISRRRPGNQVRPPRTSAFIGKLHEFLQRTSKASNLRSQFAALPVRQHEASRTDQFQHFRLWELWTSARPRVRAVPVNDFKTLLLSI